MENTKYFTDELEAFLKEEGVYEKATTMVKVDRVDLHNYKGPYPDLMTAFRWFAAPEGWNFWKKLDTKFKLKPQNGNESKTNTN